MCIRDRLEPLGTLRGTVIHLKGGGGEEWETTGDDDYRMGGLRQVYVLWASDWEQTEASGIKTAACRAATAVHWIFTDIHGGSRELGFCAQGTSCEPHTSSPVTAMAQIY